MEKDMHLNTVRLLKDCLNQAERQRFTGAIIILVLEPNEEQHLGEGAEHVSMNIPELEAVARLEHAKYFLLRDM